MEHKIKRVFAFLLSIMMMINSVPVTAFAADGEEHIHPEAEILTVDSTGHVHSLVFVEAKDASCTENGNSAYWYCSAEDCGKYFSDAEGTAEISADSTVIAAAHSLVKAENGEYWVCSGCGNKYADEAGSTPYVEPEIEHIHTLEAHGAKAATCTDAGNSAYWVCTDESCGKYFSDAEGTAEISADSTVIAAAHSLTKAENGEYWVCSGCGNKYADEAGNTPYVEPETEHTHTLEAHAANAATCTTAGNSAYWVCTDESCGKYFSDAEGTVEIQENSWLLEAEHSLTKIEAVEATCLASGNVAHWVCSACGEYFADEAGETSIDSVMVAATSGYTWDFSQNSVASTDGKKTLVLTSYATNTYTSVPVENGALTSSSRVAMTICNSTDLTKGAGITLKADEDWVFEIVAKGNGTDDIGALAVSGSYSVASATYVHINKYGELSIGKRLNPFVADDGTEYAKAYTYYKVSKNDYDASVLKSENFEVTQYHTYQLRHSADGVYSFWLDGQKVGDLALSQNHTERSKAKGESVAAREDLDVDLKITYFGCGASSAYTNFGLKGSVKYYGLYTGHTVAADDGDCTTDILCTECEEVLVEGAENHTAGTDDGDCTTAVTCAECACVAIAARSHDWSEDYTKTAEGHSSACTNDDCQQVSEVIAHTSSGAATAETPETCTVCGYVIATLGHTHGEKVTTHSGTAATCKAEGVKTYYACDCGSFFEDEACTKEISDLDSWKVLEIDPTAHKYEAGETTDATCLSHGETVSTCSVCGDESIAYIPAGSGYTWDFSGNTVTSTDGKNTLSFVACASDAHTTIPVGNGAITTQSNVTMSLSESITLKANQNWIVEVVAKGNGTKPLSNILSTGKSMSTAIYIFINAKGDLSIGKKINDFVGDDGKVPSTKYIYYQVSDKDFNASILNSDSFDVTEYHTYQLRHSAAGVYSFWVDGEKIGDLSLSENGYGRSSSYASSTAARDDLNVDLVMNYIGGGLSANSYTNFGFLGSMSYLGLYTGHTAAADDGDCTTDVVCTVCGGVAIEGAVSHTPAEDDGDCTTPITCSVCNTVTTEGKEKHTPAADDGDCTTDILCSVCGKVAVVGAENHIPAADDGDCTTDILCTVCNTVTTKGNEAHTPAADDGDCTTDILCTVCNTVTTKGNEAHTPNADDGDCTTDILCSVCNTVTAKGNEAHAPAADDGDCTTDISCTVCGKVAVEGADKHNPAADDGDCTTDICCIACGTVTTKGNEAHTPAADDGDCTTDICCTVCGTVTAKGAENHIPEADDGDCSTDVHCSVCGKVTTSGAAQHTPAEDDGDCTTDIPCTICGKVAVEGAEKHLPAADDGDCTTAVSCSVCGKVAIEAEEKHTPAVDDGDCTTDIVCSVCGTVTTEGNEKHTPAADDGDCTTDITCSVCGTVTTEGAENHIPAADDGDCTTDITCSVCGKTTAAGQADHNWTATYTQLAEGHYKTCTVPGCEQHTTLEGHISSGAATIEKPETCTVCDYVIAPALEHTHGSDVTTHAGTDATCSAEGVKTYYECSCGKFFEEEACTKEIADLDNWKVIAIDSDAHSFGEWIKEIPVSCTADGTKGHKTCGLCEKNFDAEGKLLEDLTIKSEGHNYVAGETTDATCLSHGETVYTCSECGDSYVVYAPATSGRTFDFSQNSVTSTDGKSTLTLTTNAQNTHTEVPVADGALTTSYQTAMSISNGVTLKKDADWVFEVVAKGNGTDPIGAVAVAGSYSIANSKAVGIHINKYGDLTIVKKTTDIEGVVDGYNYYKVSNEAYNASVLADDSFDVTEYHNYQLRHSAEGVYSFWLDGQKIGDLTMSENNQTREKATASESTAARPDLAADMKISYLGFGASKAYTNFGLKGSIKLHGVYTGHTAAADDGDCTTAVKCTVCDGIAIQGAEKHTPAADDGDCTTDILCTVCGKVAAAGAENHTPAADDGDCTTDILCSVCGKVAVQGAEKHIPNADDGDCTTDILCSVCGTVTTEGAEKHTPAADDGDCTTDITCFVCGTVTTAGKESHAWSETYTATIEGHYQTCTNEGCQQQTALDGHTSSGAATVDKAETCTVCEYVIAPALDHTHGEHVTTHAGKNATCSAEGAKTYYECDCDKFFEDEACTKEITDLDNWKVLAIDPDAHSFGEWIEEIPVSCEADGTKGHKTCSACEKNFDAENKVIEDLTIKSEGHKHIADESNDATCLSRGEVKYTCACGDSYVAHIPAKSGTTWDFSGNTVTSTDGENTLSFVACADESHSSIPVADGALTTQNRVTMSLSKSITLKADQEWILEAVAKGDGANPIGNIAATGKSMSTAIYVFINAKGDLSIGKKVESHVGDNGTTKANAYVYYQVSDKDFNASVLKSADFKVTDYHTYQLRHSADGVYSFWVDGQKIGNLSVTENGYNRASTYVSSTAPRTDLNVDLVMTYVGGGLSANGYTNFGIQGSMSYLGVYTGHTPVSNEGDCTKGIICSVCATQLAAGAKSHTPAADDGDCTTDILCTACPSVAVKGNVSHSFTKNLVSDVMAKPADCENPATYYIHCDNCSVKHETLTQEVGEAKGHDWDEGVVTLPPTETAVGIRTLTCKVEGCGKTTTVDIPMLEDVVSMTYDDRMPVTELGQAGAPVISEQVVTSFKVGTQTPDDNVVVFEGGKLIAVGTGTAKVTWGTGDAAVSYNISVSAAPISLIMITGHSLGAGSRGVVEQSIVCEPGQVYSTHEVANAYKLCVGNSGSVTGSVDITGMGLGYSSEIRPEEIDAMTSLGDGVVGSDSAVAYQWAKLTGEKVWVLNSSIGSSQLNSWQAGGVNYKHAVMLYKTAEAILNNEVTAGHYQVNHMGVLNFSTANGDQTWIAERYTEAFNSMWNGFRSDLALYDFDGDGTKDTVDCIGILPTWGVCSVNDWNNLNPEPLAFYNTSGKPLNGKIINYVMGAIGDNGVIIASDGARSWTSDKDVKAYFAAHPISGMYGLLQNGTYHSNPTTVRGINYDGIHFNQLGYNVQGIEAATSLYKYWYGTDETVSMKLLQSDGVTQVPATVTITEGKNYVMVPAVFPLSSKVTVEITGDDVITYDSGYVTATGIGNAQITFRDMNGKALKSVTVTTEKRSEEFYEDIAWYVWDFSGQTATSTEGNNTITATQGTMSVKDGKAEFESAVAEMTTGVRLDKTNNWCVEVTLRAKTDSNGSVIDPGSLLSSYHQAASAVTVYLDAHGSMHLMRRGDIGSYTAKYWNFAVDPGTLQANLPANFDMTDYHTYQLRCTNGVFSYWLDGKKIGDLTTTYCDSVSFTGEYMDHSGFTVRYLGNGTSSNATKYGIHAVVDEIRIYADGSSLSFDVGLDAAARMDSLQVYPGSSVVLTRPNTGDYCAKFMGWYANANLTGTCYKVGDTYVVSNLTPGTLYAKWEESLSGNGSHVWGQNQNKDAIKIPADCLNPATYYTSCNECGATSAGTEWEETFVGSSIGGHSYTAEKVADRYLKEAANCDHPAIYYKSCSSCGLSSKDQAGEATFTNGVEKHSYGTPIVTDSTCISRGENQFVCADCGDIYVTYTNALSGYTWDFSNNSATSTNGSSKLSITSYSTGNKYTAVPIENGVLNAEYRTVMTLSSKPTLKADENWAIEVVAKGDGVSPIGSVATHGSYSVGNSKTVYVYIDENGDLSIGKKYAFTADNGSIPSYQFAYYKVSNADYNASVLAQDSFDVTEYHNYQLRHSADGVFSFWVDGQKIGNLALTEDGISRTNTKLVEYTGARDDLDIDLKISYIGCGDSSSGYSNMGVRGSIKLYGIYTGHTAAADDGDCTTDILCSVCKAVVTEGAKSHTPAEDDGDCTTAVLCSVCGKTAVAAQKSHTWSKTYGHTVSGHYRSCTKCGTREAEAKHISGGAATATAAETCTVCKYVITAALNHTHGTTGTIHKGSAATCVATGTKTYYACSCGKFFEDSKYTREVSDLETWIVIAVDANAHSYTGKASDVLKSEASCTEPAQYYAICDLCHMVHESEGVAVGTALGHTFTAEIAEDKYLKNTPDCDTVAVYYKSCAVCGASSKGAEGEATFTTKERHNYKTDVKFGSTCLSHGETMLTCADCGDSYLAYVPAFSGSSWDFAQGSDTSTDGANTLTVFKSFNDTHKEIPLVDGALVSDERLTMKLSNTVTLKRTDDWVVELIAKPNGANGIRAFLSTNFAVSSATYFYIDESGDLSIAKKYSYVSDDGISIENKFSYYKVSNEDYNASILADTSFDVNEYHNYQLRCTDGVYSFWLDGQKIGDLTLTENIAQRSDKYAEYTGPRDDLDTFKISYIGCGDGTNRAGLGLLASVKYLGIYPGHDFSDTCDSTCNVAECGHVRTVTHKYTDDGDCTTATACSLCGTVIVEAKPSHSWSEDYNYNTTYHYRTCTECGKDEAKQNHVSSGSATKDKAEVCTVCGYVITAALNHIHGQVVTTHTGTPATCQDTGTKTYYECACGKLYEDEACTKEISDLKTWSFQDLAGHSFTAEIATPKYIKSEANYETSAVYYKSCHTCGLSSAGQQGEALFQSGYPSDGYFNVISKSQWDIAPGIKETDMVLNNATEDRRQEIYIMEVDINNEYTSILPSYRKMNPTYGNYGRATMSEQASWVEKNWDLNVVGAMNTFATGYSSDYYKQNPDRITEPLGLLVINGEVYANTPTYVNGTNGPETCLVVNYDEKDGVKRPASIPKVELRDVDDGLTGWEEQVVPSLWGWLVKDGVNLSNAVDHETVNPRSVLGIKADGTIVMLVNDGRRIPYSYGMSYYELGEMMLALGCVDAINCDGGGSSTFISQRPGEALKVNSHPTNGGERATITGILAISTAPANGEFVRASVTTEHTYYTPGSTVQFNAVGVDLAGNSADIPEGATWRVTEGMGTIQNGKFISNGTVGKVVAELVVDGNVAGSATIYVVNPDTVSFAQPTITIPNGKGAELNIVATYGIYDVKIKPEDFRFELSDSAIGTMDGLTLNATEDTSVTSGSITMTYLHDTTKVSTAKLVLGQASKVLADFDEGIGNWRGHRGPYRNQQKFDVYGVDRTNGQVRNGDGALAATADFTYSTTSSQSFFNINYGGETTTIENAQSLGFWVYVPEEVPFACLMTYFYSGDDTTQTKVETILNDENTAKTGWQYVTIDLSKHESITLKHDVVFMRVYYAMTADTSSLVPFSGLNYKATWYFDDITVDYSVAVDDREAPVFDEIVYAASYAGLEGLVIADSYPTFEAYVTEDLTKGNATGLDTTSAKAYIDGNAVSCSYLNGTVTVNSTVALADGPHTLEVAMSDKAGNEGTIRSSFTVAAGSGIPTVKLVPHDATKDKLLMGSQYWVDIVATNMISTQKVMLELNLNNHSTWELEHMRVADGFTATWSMDATNPTENIARIQIEKTGNAAVTGEAVLVSIPVRLWEWKESEVPANTMTTGELYTPAERWALGLIFKAELSVKIEKGTLILTDGSVVAVNDDDLVVDTELYINSYNRNDTGFFTSNKNSWHIHMIGEPESKEATCTEEGYIDRVFCVGCACGSTEAHDATDGCGAILTWGTSIAAVGHTYKVTGDRIACSCGAALEGSGIVEFEGSLYYMISGKLISGWRNVGYDWYYADPETKKLATDKQKISGVTYQFDDNGVLMLEGDGFVKIDGTTYYYQDGKMFYAGLIEIDGYYYYINSRFEVVTGRNYISKTNDLMNPGYYEFDETGKMIRPIKAEISEKAGTLKITYTENQVYNNVRFAVWSDVGGHDDLRWYAATETAEGIWTYTVDLSDHNTLGKYHIHAYTVESGVYNKLIEHVVHVEKLPEASGKVKVSDDCATMQVTYTADDQYKNIRYAVWSENGGQDDLHWYEASKNAEGAWTYTVDLARHNTVGKYHIHVYDVTGGVYTKLAEYTANVKKLAPASDNVKVSADCATMQITNAADTKYKNIHYAVWSDVGGQDDLKWYVASKAADGKWTYTVNLAAHNTVGKYHIHVYDVTSGVYTKLAEYTANVAKLAPASDNVKVSDNCSTMQVTHKADAQYQNIHYAVWSDVGGQDDLHWYAARKTAEGKWTYTVDLRVHSTAGKYHIHVYDVTAGVYTKLAEYTTTVAQLPPAFDNVKVSDDCETMKIVYEAEKQHEHVHYAVWSEVGGQDDLHWYAASVNAEGKWTYTVDLRAHNTAGKYYIHVYSIDGGVYTKLAEYTADVDQEAKSPVSVAVSSDGKTLSITYTADQKHEHVHYAVWSEVNGQDDLQWYAAGVSADGKWRYTLKLADHADAGKLNIHVYSITGTVYTKLAESTPEV